MQTRNKSLRQLASELGVSHSYLSQVIHGKRPASEKVVSALVSKSGKQSLARHSGLKSNFLRPDLLPRLRELLNKSKPLLAQP